MKKTTTKTITNFLKTISIYCLLLMSTGAMAQIISTIAGQGIPTNVPATSIQINSPAGIWVDPNGNVYFTESVLGIVRKISTSGIITTFAGTGVTGSSTGDGGPATLATMDGTAQVVRDNSNNIYVCDRTMHVIRKISSTGIITTIAGQAGVPGSSGDGGPAVSAKLNLPFGMGIDATGNLYVADNGNNKIRKISTSGIITTLAGTGTAGFSGDGGQSTAAKLNYPIGVCVDGNNNIYIADVQNFRIRKINSSGVISTVAGSGSPFSSGNGGQATAAGLMPIDVKTDTAGNIYTSTNPAGFPIPATNTIRKINVSTGIITNVSGNGSTGFSGDGGQATSAEFNSPTGIYVTTNGSIYICDSYNNRIRKIDPTGIVTTIAGRDPINNDYALNTVVKPIYGIAIDKTGGVIFADYYGGTVKRIDLSTGILSAVAGNGTWNFSGDGGQATMAQIDTVIGLCIDTIGNIYLADAGNARIRKIDTLGIITTIAGTGTNGYSGDGGQATAAKINFPSALAAYHNNLYFVDNANAVIRKIDLATGIITLVAGTPGLGGNTGDGGPATSAKLYESGSIAIDNAGNVYYADFGYNTIRKINTSGIISTIAGISSLTGGYSGDNGLAINAQLNKPFGLCFDNSGNMYFSDAGNYRIRKISPAGIISTYAASGTAGFSGDGGSATTAQVDFVSAIACDPAANSFFLADEANFRIRMISNITTPDICLVETDSIQEKFNQVIWEKSNYFNVDSFIIYREISTSPSIYAKIGAVSNDSLSIFTDTNRVYFTSHVLPNGDPTVGTYRYKIKIRDNQNNFSSYSLYHNTVYINDLQNGSFQWNLYQIEPSTNPVSGYDLYRDNTGNSNIWQYVASIAGNQTLLVDPQFSTYQNTAAWRVVASGFNCNPTLRLAGGSNNNPYASVRQKSHSNSANRNAASSINKVITGNIEINVYPNPANNMINVSCTSITNKTILSMYDATGRMVRQQTCTNGDQTQVIDTQNLQSGMYFVEICNVRKILTIIK